MHNDLVAHAWLGFLPLESPTESSKTKNYVTVWPKTNCVSKPAKGKSLTSNDIQISKSKVYERLLPLEIKADFCRYESPTCLKFA